MRPILLVLVLSALLVFTPPASPSFPGENGKLAYSVYDPTFEIEWDVVCTRNPGGGPESCFHTYSADQPAWSPNGARLAISDGGFIWTVDPDGSNRTMLTDTEVDFTPEWSPDADHISFTSARDLNSEIYVMNADGTNQTRLTDGLADDFAGSWSPDGEWMLFWSSRDGDMEIYKMRPDGSDVIQLTNNAIDDRTPDWSPDGAWITFDSNRDGPRDIYKMRADGTDVTRLTNSTVADGSPAWSPDGTRIAFITDSDNAIAAIAPDGTGQTILFTGSAFRKFATGPDWQPLPRGYVRPAGATPVRLPLVPAFKPCTSPNGSHGAPLARGSCAPPSPEATRAFVGIGDGNPAPAKSIGSVTIKTLLGSGVPGDRADVRIDLGVSNVMNTSGRSDYAGELRLELPVRITDRFNQPSPSQYGPGTMADAAIFATVPCASTVDTTLGAACAISTTADALAAGTVRAGARAVWGLGQVRLHDGGADGEADTPGDNELFSVQGVFVP